MIIRFRNESYPNLKILVLGMSFYLMIVSGKVPDDDLVFFSVEYNAKQFLHKTFLIGDSTKSYTFYETKVVFIQK